MADYNSTHTGQQIDNAVTKANGLLNITAFTQNSGKITSITINDIVYQVSSSGGGITTDDIGRGLIIDNNGKLTINIGTFLELLNNGKLTIEHDNTLEADDGGLLKVTNPINNVTSSGSNLTSITIGDDTYRIPQGSGGSISTEYPIDKNLSGDIVLNYDNSLELDNVNLKVTNPITGINVATSSENPTLRSLTIGNDTYRIPQGSGGVTSIDGVDGTISLSTSLDMVGHILTVNNETVPFKTDVNNMFSYNSATNTLTITPIPMG